MSELGPPERPSAASSQPPVIVAWQRIDSASGHAVARLEQTDSGWLVHGQEVLISGAE